MYNGSYASMQTCNGTIWKGWQKYNADGWKKISPGVFHSCGIKMDNTLWCWGQNNFGQLGDGTTTNRTAPVQVSGGGSWLDVTARGAQYQSNPNANSGTCAIKAGGDMFCWGSNLYDALGRPGAAAGDANVPTAVAFTGSWKKLAGGYYSMCAIRSDDRLFCWGNDLYGQLGDGAGNSTGHLAREVSSGGTWKEITSDSLFNVTMCGIKSDDTAWCWGHGGDRRMGNGVDSADRFIPTAISTTGVTTWKKLAQGSNHGCGIKTDDTAWCWGNNTEGQLGIGSTILQNTPVQVSTVNGATWKDISAGSTATCGTRTDDTAWCWGYGQEGNLGNGGVINSDVPIQVSGGAKWKYVSTAWAACGIRANDTLWCWAENFYGAVGNGTTTQVNTPVHIGGGSSACSSPAGDPGDMFFNQTSRNLQWCDGAIWVAAGPSVVGVPTSCSSPPGAAGDILFNSTSGVMQYCDGSLWRAAHP